MKGRDLEKYKEILEKYHASIKTEDEFYELIDSVELLASCICEFERARQNKKLKNQPT